MRISDWSSDVCSSDLQPFEQRDDDSYAQENEREDVSRVEAALEPPSQNQQSCSRQTPHKVGSLDERQRQAMARPEGRLPTDGVATEKERIHPADPESAREGKGVVRR